jgi:hypothetical protein
MHNILPNYPGHFFKKRGQKTKSFEKLFKVNNIFKLA